MNEIQKLGETEKWVTIESQIDTQKQDKLLHKVNRRVN